MNHKVKGHLFNLIIYTHEKRRKDYFAEMIRGLIQKFPCRLIYVCADRDTQADFLEVNGNEDEIIINASWNRLSEISYTILPRLIPDLPIYLVWGQDPTSENPLLPHLEKLANRLIFDGECAGDLQVFCRKMLQKVETLNIEFMDINWAEMSGWRDVISQVFHSSEKLSYLNQCETIRIKYNQLDDPFLDHDAIQAIYLQGWLAAQMGWSFERITEESETHQIVYENANVSLLAQNRPSLPPGQIFEVSFEDRHKLKTTLTFADKQSKVFVYVSSADQCQIPYSIQLAPFQKGLTAMKEIFYFNPSTHYRNMLSAVSQIKWTQF